MVEKFLSCPECGHGVSKAGFIKPSEKTPHFSAGDESA